MNAIIALCHFCEAHGPRAVFCTYATDGTNPTAEIKPSTYCSACTSVGPDTVLVTKNDDGTSFCSRESTPNIEVTNLLRQAAIRSLTCEVSWNKEGGVVFFGDARGHVLSSTFQLRDSGSRGLKRWFSFVVLMKDKMLLLSIMPFLSEHMQTTAKELQEQADKVYDDDQKICSQRALRLNTGRNDFGPSRSLVQLTGEENIFKKLHLTFSWMLQAGAMTYTETLYNSRDLLTHLDPDITKGSIFAPNACTVPNIGKITLRALEDMLGKAVFKSILYCTLTGIEILVKGVSADHNTMVKVLTDLLPVSETSENPPAIGTSDLADDITPSAIRCILEETETNNYVCKWPGVVPVKCPTLMTKIESAICNSKFDDAILQQHIKCLQLEWLGIARALRATIEASGPTSDPVVKLKQVFGVSPHDDLLIHYWINTFCT